MILTQQLLLIIIKEITSHLYLTKEDNQYRKDEALRQPAPPVASPSASPNTGTLCTSFLHYLEPSNMHCLSFQASSIQACLHIHHARALPGTHSITKTFQLLVAGNGAILPTALCVPVHFMVFSTGACLQHYACCLLKSNLWHVPQSLPPTLPSTSRCPHPSLALVCAWDIILLNTWRGTTCVVIFTLDTVLVVLSNGLPATVCENFHHWWFVKS